MAVPQHRRRRRSSLFGLLVPLAAAAAIALVVLSVRVIQLDAEAGDLEAVLAEPLSVAAERALADPASALVTLAAPGGAGTPISVDIVYQTDGTGYVLGASLPALAEDRTYQLWAIVEDRVISAGVLGADPGISPFQIVGELTGLAITEEIAGGVVSSGNDPVAVWLAAA